MDRSGHASQAPLLSHTSENRVDEEDWDKNAHVTPMSSVDGSELYEFTEFSRPRRSSRSWLARLLMTIRPRRTYRAIGVKPTKKSRWRHVSVRTGGICLGLTVVMLAVFGIVHIWNYLLGQAPAFWDDDYDNWLPNWGSPGQPGEYVAHYLTDFTRDILPIPCHSHNDYWRRIPLFEAIRYGCTGVEADVWLFDDELYVGHDTASLTRNRTFRSLYVYPLVDILDKQNPSTKFSKPSRNGVFDKDPSQTLILLVDFKNNGHRIFHSVMEQLSALREKDYLTYYDGKQIVHGPVTVVGTGNMPFDVVTAEKHRREIFFDAPLDQMWEKPTDQLPADISAAASSGQGLVGDVFDSTNSYYASVDFRKTIGILWRGGLSASQIEKIRGQIQGAHARGLKVRYWNAPAWPISIRNHVWHVLWKEGADMLNVDDLRSAARRDWRRREERLRDS